MESTESQVASLEESRERSPGAPDPLETEGGKKPTHIRFLVSNVAAGSVIGKGGSTITDFQSKSGARIQLSRNQEFFPGTMDRIIMISGTAEEVVKGLELILYKLEHEMLTEDGNGTKPRTRVRLVVPNGSCGSIIGKGGATIKSFIEKSGAGIKISPLDNTYYGLSDRLVTVTGTTEEQMQAIDLILSKLAEDSHYFHSVHGPYSYAVGYNQIIRAPNGARGKFQDDKEGPISSVTISVSDEHIGLVLGRGGRNIMEINQVTGARVKISDRGDFFPGTTDRKVTITGSQRAIREAKSMIELKVANVSERATD